MGRSVVVLDRADIPRDSMSWYPPDAAGSWVDTKWLSGRVGQLSVEEMQIGLEPDNP